MDNPAKNRAESSMQWNTTAFIASDPVSIRDFFHDEWSNEYSPREGSNLIFANARSEIAYEQNGWKIGYVHRLDAMIEASRDFTDLFHSIKKSESLVPGKTYNLAIEISGFQADGLHVSKGGIVYDRNDLTVQMGLGATLLRGIRMQRGSANGYATAVSDKDYNFNAYADYYYTQNLLYDRNVVNPEGYGMTTDIGMVLDWGKVHTEVTVNDILGVIRWKMTPYTNAYLTSNTKYYDANGYVNYSPTISGLETYRNFDQRLDPKGEFFFRYDGGGFKPFFSVETVRGYIFPEAGGILPISHGRAMTLAYDTFFHTVAIGYEWNQGSVVFRSDSLHGDQVASAGILCQLRYPF